MKIQPHFVYIEDHLASRQVLQIMLQELLGFQQLTLFEDTQNVLERLEQLSPPADILFLDLNLEPLSGYAVCALLRAQPAFNRVMIVAMTASISGEQYQQLRDLGFNGIIEKPLNHRTFPRMLQHLLEGKEVWGEI